MQELDVTQSHVHFQAIRSIVDFERFFNFRVGVEGEAAAAANYYSDLGIGDLRRVAAQSRCIDRITLRGDFLFHLAVVQASDNLFYVRTLISLKDHFPFGMNLMRSFTGRQIETDAMYCSSIAPLPKL